jgi:hypothetical protein
VQRHELVRGGDPPLLGMTHLVNVMDAFLVEAEEPRGKP